MINSYELVNRALDLVGSRGPMEFVKFCAVGLSGVGVNLGLYYVFTRGAGLSIHTASLTAIELSILWNFMLNDGWTFRGRATTSHFWQRLLKFHLVCGVGGVLNYLVLIVLVTYFGWWDISANLMGIIVSVFAKFAMNSAWTWR